MAKKRVGNLKPVDEKQPEVVAEEAVNAPEEEAKPVVSFSVNVFENGSWTINNNIGESHELPPAQITNIVNMIHDELQANKFAEMALARFRSALGGQQ